MTCYNNQVIVLNIVGLTPFYLKDRQLTPNLNKLAQNGSCAKMRPTFPAVTGTVQATMTTGYEPNQHGIIGNGMFDRKRCIVNMWEQTAAPVEGKRIWDILKELNPKASTAVIFWQNIKYATADIVLTPSPIHHDKGMDEWCFSKPAGLYESLVAKYGPFPLKNFWGPLASFVSSKWIAEVSLDVIDNLNPNLTLIYLPNLDYNAQKFGPQSIQALQAVEEIDNLIGCFIERLRRMGKLKDTSLLVISEYAIHAVNKPVYINRILREEGWLKVVKINDKEYLDLYHSHAFALSDHQVAHIYIQNHKNIKDVKQTLERTEGISEVLGDIGKRKWNIDHPRSGELIALAEYNAWFPYYWWNDEASAPNFTRTVNIHAKPGYDPVELFIDNCTHSIPLNANLVKGSHGLAATEDEDFVCLIADGPLSEIVNQKTVWKAREIPFLILNMLGFKS